MLPISEAKAGLGIGYYSYEEYRFVSDGWNLYYYSVYSTSFRILFPFWIGEHSVLEPTFGLNRRQVGDYHYDKFNIGSTLRFHSHILERVPYFGFYLNIIREGETPIVNVELGPVLGGEYFLSDHFSLGIEARLVLTMYDVDTHPRDRVFTWNTQGMLAARVYFSPCRVNQVDLE